jgi:transposase
LRSKVRGEGYDGSVSARAQIVLWHDEGYPVADVAKMAGTTRPTVYKWIKRYERQGIEGLADQKPTGRPRSISDEVRSRIIAPTRQTPSESTELTHWSSKEMARYVKRAEGISVSHNFVATLWREHGLHPHQQGTFTLSADPEFAEKVVEVVGLYLDPPQGAVVLSGACLLLCVRRMEPENAAIGAAR